MTKPPYTVTQNQKQHFVQSRKKRNIAIGLALGGFIVMIYCVTVFKLGSQIFV